MKRFAGAFLFALLLAIVLSIGMNQAGRSQTYPSTTPVYIPTATLGTQTLTATGNSSAYNVNGQGQMYLRVLGTNSGLVSTVQVTESKQTSPTPTWTSVAVEDTATGAKTSTIGANGLYRLNVSGISQVRLNIGTLSSGNVLLTMAASPAVNDVKAAAVKRYTYSGVIAAHAPAASATDILTVTGSATRTIQIEALYCDGTATANGIYNLRGVLRSTADTGGTPAAVTAVAHDSSDPAASATAQTWAGGLPTTGTLIGIARAANLQLTATSSTTYGAVPINWSWGDNDGQALVLRGTGAVFALNANGVSIGAGGALTCRVQWTEE